MGFGIGKIRNWHCTKFTQVPKEEQAARGLGQQAEYILAVLASFAIFQILQCTGFEIDVGRQALIQALLVLGLDPLGVRELVCNLLGKRTVWVDISFKA